MKVKVGNYLYVDIEKETLLEGKDFKLIGFYEDNGMFSEVKGMLQPVYLMDGKYYVEELMKYPLIKVIKSIESTYHDLGDVRSYIRQYLYDIRHHISYEEFWEREYRLVSKKIGSFFEIQEYPDKKIIRQECLYLEPRIFIGAINLPSGQIVVGDEEFIEKVIMECVDDLEERYKLLDILYKNCHDYHNRQHLINDIYDNHYDELSLKDQNKIADQKEMTDFLIYGLNLMEDIKNSKVIKK